jgi:serine/threonine-protein kinase
MYGPGALLADRYRLDERVGGGGMGEVWRATDLVLDRTVAVKVMRPELLEEAGFADRFLIEARTMATIRHRGVVGVHDYRSDHTGAFLVMEYVAGESLSRLLNRLGRLPPVRAMTLVAQAADALQAAHDRGVVHRDIKPGNLLVTEDDQLVLTDFGIARSAASTPLTATGAVIGTPSYLAPEQVLGKAATARSDLYSLGVVAYECLAGRRPFEGENPFDIAMKRLREPPPTLAVDVPPAVLAVVERALASDPERRWPSAADLAAAARGAAAPGGAATRGSVATGGTVAPGPPEHPPADRPGHPPPDNAGRAAPEPAGGQPDQGGHRPPDGTRPPPAPPAFAPARAAVPYPPPALNPTILEPPAASQPVRPDPAGPPPAPPAAPRSQSPPPFRPAPPPAGWPGPPPRPPTVFLANLLLRVAAISLLIYCVGSASVMDIVAAETGRALGPRNQDALGLVVLFAWTLIGVLFLVALLLLLLAWRVNRRSRAARAWTFALGFFMLCCCAPLGVLSSAGGEVEPGRSDFERQLAAAMPPWYEPVTSASVLILVAALVAALVLLMLPPANQFFRATPQPAFYYPYYPYQQPPPRS